MCLISLSLCNVDGVNCALHLVVFHIVTFCHTEIKASSKLSDEFIMYFWLLYGEEWARCELGVR